MPKYQVSNAVSEPVVVSANMLHSVFSEYDILFVQAEKRAHHNALERKRRDHIKDSFSSLRDSVPALQGEKVNSTKVNYISTLGHDKSSAVKFFLLTYFST